MQLQNEIVKKHTPIKSLLIDWLIIFGTYLFIRIFFALFVEMSRNVQSGNTQNLKSSAAPVRLPAAPASTPGTSQAAAQAGCVYRP